LYEDLVESGHSQVKLIGVGKSQHMNWLDNWTDGNDASVCADQSGFAGYAAWNEWEASQRDLYVLDHSGNLVLHQNITGGLPNDLASLIIGLIEQIPDCDPDLMCGEVETCCDGLLYPTTCCSDNCDEPIDECGECTDGDNTTCCLDVNAVNYLQDGTCEYHYTIDLVEGANLVSFWALPEDNSLDNMFIDLDGIITGIIGEGTAAIPDDIHGWTGSLTEITCLSGYWITVSESVTLNVIATELCPCDIVLLQSHSK
jgi:hypothetical protein